jgi:hypothetical protein
MQICWGLKATQNYKTLRIHGFVVKLHGVSIASVNLNNNR